DAEPPGLEALAAGEIDAFLCGEPVGQEKIAEGLPLRMLEPPAYHTMKTGYIDRGLALAPGPFIEAINAAIARLHADGRLRALSEQYFGVDYATAAAEFDLDSVAQTLP
ncbi:MAG TPA: transporter substrate-binding domain-containing protein, partial [Candidatus Limnocylindrales bacterium]|nr:transporter substrate-binding domain-containing protein [Candidatus Limnocylindrales bacterium]